jgi:DNA replication protein DnaC
MSLLERTTAQYRTLRLTAAASGLPDLLAEAENQELSYLDFARRLVDHEIAVRTRTRIERHLKQAQFPAEKPLESFDYRHQTTITKRQVNALLDFGFIDQRENLVFIGPPGVGKTHLAIGIGQKAVQAGYKVLFRTALELIEELELAEMKGELKKRLTQLSQVRCDHHRRTGLLAHDTAGPLQPVSADQQPVRVPLDHPDHQQRLHRLG